METYYKNVLEPKIEIDSDLITEEFKDFKNDITCMICLKIVNLPVVCEKCSTLFCKVCIDEWLKKNKKCPMRCVYKESPLSRISLNLLNKVKINCTNREKGCKANTSLDGILKHLEKECEYTFCECTGCHDIFCRMEIVSHVKNCGRIEEECAECLVKISRPMMSLHKQSFCLNRVIKCKDCNGVFSISIFDSHSMNCNLSDNVCEFCFKTFKKSEKIEDHKKEECVTNIRNYYIDIITVKDYQINNLRKSLLRRRKLRMKKPIKKAEK
jgi:hypothetical protein